LTSRKKSDPRSRTIEILLPMMSMAPRSFGVRGRGFSKNSDVLDRVSPPLRADSFEKTGHIQVRFIAKIPREDETPAECRRSRDPRGRTPRRVSRLPGGYETVLRGEVEEQALPLRNYRETTARRSVGQLECWAGSKRETENQGRLVLGANDPHAPFGHVRAVLSGENATNGFGKRGRSDDRQLL
jgi:hypothetical protein